MVDKPAKADHGDQREDLMLSRRQIVFVHVAKCGGTAITSYMGRMLRDGPVIRTEGEVDQLSKDEVHAAVLVHGHMTRAHLAKVRPDALVLSMLRDPVDRVISNYFFIRGQDQTGRNAPEFPVFVDACKSLSLAEIVNEQHPQVRHWMSDYVSRQLGPIEALARFAHIGVYEDFGGSLNIFQMLLGWPLLDTLPKDNVTEERLRLYEVDPAIIEAIEAANPADMALYDHAVNLHRKRLAEMWAAIEQRRTSVLENDLRSPDRAVAERAMKVIMTNSAKRLQELSREVDYSRHGGLSTRPRHGTGR